MSFQEQPSGFSVSRWSSVCCGVTGLVLEGGEREREREMFETSWMLSLAVFLVTRFVNWHQKWYVGVKYLQVLFQYLGRFDSLLCTQWATNLQCDVVGYWSLCWGRSVTEWIVAYCWTSSVVALQPSWIYQEQIGQDLRDVVGELCLFCSKHMSKYALQTAVVSDMDRTKWIVLTKYKCFKVSWQFCFSIR